MTRGESWNPLLKSYPDSEKINAVSIGAETLYTRLIARSDDVGRFYGDPAWVLARLFTARMVSGEVSAKHVACWIDELVTIGLVARYAVKGIPYIQIIDVKKCVRRDVRQQIMFPGPDGADADTMQTRPMPVTNPIQPRPDPGPLDLDQEPDREQEPEMAAAALIDIDEEAVMVFPCRDRARGWPLTRSKLAEYVASYPEIDVEANLRAVLQWLRDNGAKTAVGTPRCLNTWLRGEQIKAQQANGKGARPGSRYQQRQTALDQILED
jgi:hypothetical protein